MQDSEPRTFGEIAEHARIAQEQLATAQGAGYIVPVGKGVSEHLSSLPGFKTMPRSYGSAALETRNQALGAAADHIRFLEHVVERLACQVAEMAERLDGRQEGPYAEKARRIRDASEALLAIRDELEASQDEADREAWVSLEGAFDHIDNAISTFENPEE